MNNPEPKNIGQIRDLLDLWVIWASAHPDVQALALVGSYARGVAREDSDIDLVVLTEQPEKYLKDLEWIKEFGDVEKHQTEDYGKLTSLRVHYKEGPEVEYGISIPETKSHTFFGRHLPIIWPSPNEHWQNWSTNRKVNFGGKLIPG